MSLKIIWSLRFKTSPGRGGNLRRVIQGMACVMTRTVSHSERDNLRRAPASGWGYGAHKRPLLSASSVQGRPQGCEGRGGGSLQIWAWNGGYTFQTLPSLLFFFFFNPAWLRNVTVKKKKKKSTGGKKKKKKRGGIRKQRPLQESVFVQGKPFACVWRCQSLSPVGSEGEGAGGMRGIRSGCGGKGSGRASILLLHKLVKRTPPLWRQHT